MPASTAPIRFRATLQLAKKTATGIVVPDDVVERLGGGGRPAVHVTLNDHAYRSTIATRGGEYKLPVSAEPREVVLPQDFAHALDAHPQARRFYDGLSPSKRKAFVTVIEDATTPETRQRRVAKAVEKLREGRDR